MLTPPSPRQGDSLTPIGQDHLLASNVEDFMYPHDNQPISSKMSVNYIHTGEIWNWETIKFDDFFPFMLHNLFILLMHMILKLFWKHHNNLIGHNGK